MNAELKLMDDGTYDVYTLGFYGGTFVKHNTQWFFVACANNVYSYDELREIAALSLQLNPLTESTHAD